MKHSDRPFIELKKAEVAIQGMRAAADMHERDRHWIEFLHAIERTWSKSVAHFSKSPKWSNWHAPFLKQRRRDPLLSYLVNARGAEEHSANDVTEKVLGSVGVNSLLPGGRLFVRELIIEDGQVKSFDSTPATFDVRQPVVAPVAIDNRGVTYPPPAEHLGEKIDPSDVISMAELALSYYAKFLDEAEHKFVE